MIVMFVGNQDAVEVFNVLLDRRQPRQRFAFAKSGVNKEAGALRLEKGNVPRAARRQYGNPQADRFPLKSNTKRNNFQIIAERTNRVNGPNCGVEERICLAPPAAVKLVR